MNRAIALSFVLTTAAFAVAGDTGPPPTRYPFFGDTHVHTRLSLDAGLQGTRMTPRQAYEFARGLSVPIQPFAADGTPLRHLRLARPLDFVAISDHAEFFGEIAICEDPAALAYNSVECLAYRQRPNEAFLLFNALLSTGPTNLPVVEQKRVRRMPFCGLDGGKCVEASRTPWEEEQAAANEADLDPAFTAFVGYEWSGSPDTRNLHRNVIFRNQYVPRIPRSYFEAPDPELLWKALQEDCQKPCEVLTIPHNSNLSSGKMFRTTDSNGDPFTLEYAHTRQFFEPLVEIFQHKGDSECFQLRGPGKNDELCGFEKFPFNNLIADRFDGFLTAPPKESDFVRDALKTGLAEEQRLGVNPFKYGIIGSSDTHQGTPGAVVEDARFPGHGGAGHASQGTVAPGLQESIAFNPGGLAGVWAEANTRDAIFDAMRRRDTFGTSGPRMLVHLFGGWDLGNLCAAEGGVDAAGYQSGVPMGGDLPAIPAAGAAPSFLVWALKDPGKAAVPPDPSLPGDLGAFGEPSIPLERVQVIKGWIDGYGERHEKVYDVAVGAAGGTSIDPGTCAPEPSGPSYLCTVWADPDFEATEPAFYYARVLQNATCRWSTLQCNAGGVDCSKPDQVAAEWQDCCKTEYPKTVQERAWTSPLWYRPTQATP